MAVFDDDGCLPRALPRQSALACSQVASLAEDVVEKLDLVFYSEAERAVSRVVEM